MLSKIMLLLRWNVDSRQALHHLQLVLTAFLLAAGLWTAFHSKDVLLGELGKALSVVLSLYMLRSISKQIENQQ